MKIGAATILSALAFCSLVSAAPVKRDDLKCHAVSGPGSLAALKHVDTAEKQYFAFREVEGQEGEMLATSDGPGQEVQFYECEKPAEEYNPGEDGGYRNGVQMHYGQLRMKEDPSQCVTRGTDRKLRVEVCEEGETKKMEGQWFSTWKEKKGGASKVTHAPLQGGKRRGQVATEDGWVDLYTLTPNNGKFAVALHIDNGSWSQEE